MIQQSVHPADLFILEIFLRSKMASEYYTLIFVLVNLHLWASMMLIFWIWFGASLTQQTLLVNVCQLKVTIHQHKEFQM